MVLLLLAAVAAHSSMSCWQWGPVKPGGQEQVPGPLHSPPLSQGVGHTAETREKGGGTLVSRMRSSLLADEI
jgi:hypothetical protein